MKKIVCLLLIAMMLCPALIACGKTAQGNTSTAVSTTEEPATTAENPTEASTSETPVTTETPAPTPVTTETSTPTPQDPNKTIEFDNTKFYEIKTTDGERLEWNTKRFTIAKASDTEGTFWNIDTVELASGKSYSVFFGGDSNKKGLDAGNGVRVGGKLVIGNIGYPVAKNTQSWIIRDNGDGTYKIHYGQIPNFAVSLKDGAATLELAENASDFVISEIEFTSEKYAQWTSEKGDLTVRLPIDVVDQIYNRVKKYYKTEGEAELKEKIENRMQLFAESAQKCYDSLIELTGFTPYKHIVIYAYEHQNVMAGVVGADPNIYVNVDWYVDDMEKMYRRWTEGQEDYNFCILHEMGHMFDWDRGWNFESEMQTDFKASYVLYAHRNDEFGAWAAPAEYGYRSVFSIENIDTEGYKGLAGSGMKYEETDTQIRYTYSIYRSAQMYVSYVKYCEETEGLNGFEGMKKMFHWFQDEGMTTSSNSSAKRFELFNEKLTEFCGYDINTFMIEHYNEQEWLATAANASGKGAREKDSSGQETGWLYINKEA